LTCPLILLCSQITPLSEKVYVLRSGSAADTQAISAYVQLYIAQHQAEDGDQIRVATAARLAQNMAYQNKEMLQAGLIIAGWDKQSGGTVWGIPLGGTMVPAPYAIGGSGSAYIYGFVDKNWKEGMSEEDAKAFVVKALSYAMARDASSGGCIRTVTITSEGVERDFLPGSNVPSTYDEMKFPGNK
jgi:20S proteasome subunit beta 1